MTSDLHFLWFYIKTTLKNEIIAGALTVLLWAGIVVFLNEQQLEAEDGSWDEV